MPTYTYECDRCKRRVEEVRPVSARKSIDACPKCSRGYLRLVPSLGPGVFPGADHWRTRFKSRGTP